MSDATATGLLESGIPVDDHDARLLDNVRPEDWKNPGPAKRYHLVVIGAGPAGLVCAAGAAGLGARVALVEKHLLGGDCLNTGCVPSKAVIAAARRWSAASQGEDFGLAANDGRGDFSAVMDRMRRLRADISDNDSTRRLNGLGVDVFLGEARFTSPTCVRVDGHDLRFRRAVVATGARAAAPPIDGLAETGYLTNESVFSLQELPKRLAIIGAGPIGCELGQSFARFGARVTLLDMASHVLPREDEAPARLVQTALLRDGLRFVAGASIKKVRSSGSAKIIDYGDGHGDNELKIDEILVCSGRAPNVENLGLEEAGIEFNRSGVSVDDFLRTTNRKVFGVGDVASAYRFTHAADAQARAVIQNALFPGRARTSKLVIPWCTYTSPEIAHVGLSEKEASARNIEIDTVTVDLAEVDRAIVEGETEGLLRVHLEKGTDRIRGATLVAANAGDIIGQITLAMTQGIGLEKLGATIQPYPTQAEVIRKAADAWRRRKLTPRTRRILGTYFKLFR